MAFLCIEGLHKLQGSVTLHGAKNSALPILAATLLADGVSEIVNCPRLSDVTASVAILRELGCRVAQERDVVTVDATGFCRTDVSEPLMREMRSSIVFLGAILARGGEAHLCFPGGCELGPRPIDLHLAALKRLGVTVSEERGRLHCRRERRLKGARIVLTFPSVGATENILLAAVTAEGTTEIINAAREPEIGDLCAFLNACGARISLGREGKITVEGVERLQGCRFSVMPDRIEAATYMAAVAVTSGAVRLTNVQPETVMPVFSAFEEAGCSLTVAENEILLRSPAVLRGMKEIRTMPYPGFPTDAQAPVMAMAAVAEGNTLLVETIFENRFKYVGELNRMGAHIRVLGRMAVAQGVPRLFGAEMACTDLRGGAAMVVAALAAEGYSQISAVQHIDRGYQDLVECLRGLGAVISREEGDGGIDR